MKTRLCVASGSKKGGIYQICMDERGEPDSPLFLELGSVCHMTQNGQHIYAVLDHPFTDSGNSGLTTLAIKDGELRQASPILSTAGQGACYTAVCPKTGNAYVVNAQSKGISCLMDRRVHQVLHNGNHTNMQQRCVPYPCHAAFLFDGRTLCVTDKGMDSLMMYTLELNFLQHIQLPKGRAPHQMIVSRDQTVAYLINEIDASVTVLQCEDQSVCPQKTYKIMYEDRAQDPSIFAAAACLSEDDQWLMVSARGSDTISCFSVAGDTLELTDILSCGGQAPASLCFAAGNRFLLCANEDSGTITALSFKGGELGPARIFAEVEHPLFLLEIKE